MGFSPLGGTVLRDPPLVAGPDSIDSTSGPLAGRQGEGARKTSRKACHAGFGWWSKSLIEVLAGQGNQSWSIQTRKPPRRGKRIFEQRAAWARPLA